LRIRITREKGEETTTATKVYEALYKDGGWIEKQNEE
jgi:hypothetical protein